MQILTTQQIAETINQPKFATADFATAQMANFIENQPFLFEYSARPELALELGMDEKRWFPDEGDITDDYSNTAMLSVVASLLSVVAEFVDAIPYVMPADLMERERTLGPQLLTVSQDQGITDEEFFDTLVERCRQKDLLSFALDILNMHHEETLAESSEEKLEEWSQNFLRDAIKMRIIVDTLDHVTEPQTSN